MARKKSSGFNYLTIAIFGGIFILGVGIGIAFSSTANLSPQNFASREYLDRSAPNAELCVQYGASAIVMEARSYVTLNPFNVYVAQPAMMPGCVLRRQNWAIIERKNLVSSKEVRDCKQRMNTFGYTGDLDEDPRVQCVYQNDSDANDFLKQPGVNMPAAPESKQF